MMTMLCRVAALAGVLATAMSAQSKTELTGFIGHAKTYDDEGSLGGGLSGGFGLSYRFRPSLAAEFEYSRFENQRDIAGVFRFSGTGNWFTGNVLKHWGVNTRFQPYVSGGFGGMTYTGGISSPAVSVGFGAKGYVTEHFFIRPEIKVLRTVFGSNNAGPGAEPPISNLRISIGAGWRF
jgi:hypothetical protein